ncbi:MAG TPA: RNB domain-containing ribonuclease, partial [Candidatus Acidoferrales bacterium]|nr:RNB domain-containing ribonuclease [Candidatus Acidoferrales bacterium]
IMASMTITPTQTDELKRLASDAMRAHDLVPDFSTAALAEASAATAATESSAEIRDLRTLLWSSIDNDDSLDLDQIEVTEALVGGKSKLMVGIADVDSVVKAGSAVDEHARTNTTSVYTAAEIFAMLPERLSTNLTSLAQDQDRLCVVIEMTVDASGTLGQSTIYRALVRNRAKLAYRSVAAWLQGTGATPSQVGAVAGLEAQLRLQDTIAQALKRRRQTKGALEFDTAENRAVYEGGVLIDLQPDPKNRAQELIEEIMIAANGVTARFLQQHGRTSLRRILRTPKRWDRIVQLAKDAGQTLPDAPDALALNAFLTTRRQSDPTHFADLSLAVIKCLGAGEYVAERPGQTAEGHFGLAVRDYTHSTAPNRRFPDLLTQRLVKAVLKSQPTPYSDTELPTLASHCTEQESNAKKVERQIEKSAAAMLLGSRIGVRFEGIVTGASEKGTWVRIVNPAAEGRVVKDFQGFDVGNHVHVQLLHVDVARGFIDFAGVK